MPPLQTFKDFLEATRDVKVTPRDALLHEATKRTYFLGKMVKGRRTRDVFRGGSKLVEKIDFDTGGTFAFYNPNDEETPGQTDSLETVTVNWAFSRAYYSFVEETIELNEGDTNRYVDLKHAYEQRCLVDKVNGMEEALWALPNEGTMEASDASPREAYSIPSLITRDGGAPSSTNGGVAAGTDDWDTVMTKDPDAIPGDRWKNQSNTYDPANPDDLDDGLLQAFDDMVLLTGFEMPDGLRRYMEDDGLQYFNIVTSRDGINFYKARLREVNDQMSLLRDPAIPGVQYQGVPIKYVSQLDEAGWTDGQPDYFWINLRFLFPFFHTTWYMRDKLTGESSSQPNSYVVWKFTMYNLFMRSRRRQGRISAS